MQVPVTPSVAASNTPLQSDTYVPPASAFGGNIGAGLQDVGNNLGALGEQLKQTQLQTQRFAAMKSFADFQTSAAAKLTELQQNAPVGQSNFTDQAVATYKNMGADFLNNMAKFAPDLQAEFDAKVGELGSNFAQQAAGFQLKSQSTYFQNSIEDEANKSLMNIGANPSSQTLDAERKRLTDFIGAAAISPEEKVALARKYYTQMEAVAYKGQVKQNLSDPAQTGAGQAVDLINTLGGDSAHSANLSFEENQQVLTDRVNFDTQQIAKSVGLDQWGRVPAQVQAAILSNTDSRGGKADPAVMEAVKSGDLAAIVSALRAQGTPRANQEAAIVNGDVTTKDAQLDMDHRFANVPYEDRLTLRADAQKEVTAQQVEAQKAADAQQNAFINSLKIAVDRGEAGQTDVDQALQMFPNMKASDYAELQHGVASSTNKIVQAGEGIQKLQHGLVFDPSDPKDKARLNAMVGDQGIAAINALDGNYMAQAVIPLVKQAQDVPTAVAGTLTGMIRNPDPNKAMWALDALSQIQQASPKGFSQRFGKDVESNVLMFQIAKDYYPPDRLLSIMQGGKDSAEQQDIDSQRKIAQKQVTDATALKVFNPAQDFINNVRTVPGGWGQAIGGKVSADLPMSPQVNAALSRDFNSLYVDEFPKYRDPQQTAAAVTALMKREWAVTNVGGTPALMKNPPELMGYPPIGGKYDWITQQVREDLKLPESTQFQLIADEQTRKEGAAYQVNHGPQSPDDRAAPPSYLVYVKAPDGAHLAVDEKGVPQRLFFNVTPQLQGAAAQHLLDADQNVKNKAFLDMYTSAAQHSVATGIPIPGELVNEYRLRFGDSGPAPASFEGAQ